ncbi:MAG: insulinase family protein [Chloroflexota bacterium]|nr:insulinase family protein [Chloroflexota bacterium]
MTSSAALRPPPTEPRPYHFPPFERTRLANGLTVWLLVLPEREVANVHLLVDAGAASEEEAHGGEAALTARLLVTGTRRLDAAAFAEATERLGIEVSSESSWDFARAAFQTLPRYVDEGLALLAEMVREPRFDASEFDRLQSERLADIMQARADPSRLADEMFLRHIYAPGSPYGRLSAGVPETVAALTVDDVKAFHDASYLPSSAHLIIAGAFDLDQVLRSVEERLGDWSGEGQPHREIEAVPAGPRRVVLVDRPGSVQTEIRVGLIGIDRHDSRFFPATVMTTLLGGVFGSRLNIRLREELGYTYGAHAALDPRRSAGPLAARAGVHTEVTVPAITETLSELNKLRTEVPPDDQLRTVKDFLIGVFPLRFETTGGLSAALEPLAIYGLPDDWWSAYRGNLEAVTPAAVHKVATELLRPDDYLILAVGDASRIGDELAAANFGPLERASD